VNGSANIFHPQFLNVIAIRHIGRAGVVILATAMAVILFRYLFPAAASLLNPILF
jgi:hypothetical protein